MGSSSAIKVSIRLRPLNKRELGVGAKNAIAIDGVKCTATSGNETKTFSYDECFWSFDKSQDFASQEIVFDSIGTQLLKHALDGYNCCLMAYGQTGAGKSFSMMGSRKQPGLIPQIASSLYEEAKKLDAEGIQTEIEVSYMEIYCEKVKDLLGKKTDKPLRVREHPALGPYVEGLKKLAATSSDQALQIMTSGNAARTVAATNMNQSSSRSHAVFQIFIKQKKIENGVTVFEKKSKVALIDLAGSERSSSAGTVGTRLKEGGAINKSLTTLGKVIHALSEKKKHVPYRESVLTWLLKDSLGGNSRTWVLAAISPSNDCVEETLSTLRWADRARKVQCHAVVNEDPTTKLINALRTEIIQLKALMESEKKDDLVENSAEVQDMLRENQRLVGELETDWDEKVDQSKKIIQEKVIEMENLGVRDGKSAGLSVPKQPHLVNLCPDPLLSECLLYLIGSTTMVGNSSQADIILEGDDVADEHATFEGNLLKPVGPSDLFVNGKRVTEAGSELKHGDRIIFGKTHVFRFASGTGLKDALETSESSETASVAASEIHFDWDQAQKELLDETGIDMEKEMERQLLTYAEEAYRREKQKAENGFVDPAETSWRLIKALRDRLQGSQVQKIMKTAGVIGSNMTTEKEELKSQAAEASWVTMADVKLQAVKELCYEVALGDFDMGQEELEQLSKRITINVTTRFGKDDPAFEDSWRSVLRDAADTIGLDVKISEPDKEDKENKKKEMDKLKAKLDEVSRREQIKDMELAQLRAKVVAQETGLYVSHKFVRSKEFDKPSPGVIVPGNLEGEDLIEWLMENDQAFRRGRIRWEKQQKVHQENLQKRQVIKQKRKDGVVVEKTGSTKVIKNDTSTDGELGETRSVAVKFAQDVRFDPETAQNKQQNKSRSNSRRRSQRAQSANRERVVVDGDFRQKDRPSNGRSRDRYEKENHRRERAKSQGAPEHPLLREKSFPKEEPTNKLQNFRQKNSTQKSPKLQRRNSQKNEHPVYDRIPWRDKHVPSQQWGEDLRLNRGKVEIREVVQQDDSRFHDYHDHRGNKKKKNQNDRRKDRETRDANNNDREVVFNYEKSNKNGGGANNNGRSGGGGDRPRRSSRGIVMYQPPHRRSDV